MLVDEGAPTMFRERAHVFDGEIRAAGDGYRRFGFAAIAALLGTVTARGEEDELAADAAYARELPDDGLLRARFVADYEARPSDYAE